MKNPFSKKRKSLDSVINNSVINSQSVAEIDRQADSGRPSLTKTEAAYPVNTGTRRGPTVESHGFEYDESADMPPQNGINDSINDSDAAMNPYRFNETEDANAPLSLNQYNVSNWYAMNGRIGRVKFLAYNFIWSLLMLIPILVVVMLSGPAIMAALATQSGSSASLLGIPVIIGLVLIIPAYIYSAIILPRRRLHDIGKSGWWLLLNLVPLANLVLLFWLFLKSGDVGANEYGLPSAPNTTAEKVLAGIFPALFVLGVLAGVIISIMVDTQAPVLPDNPDINTSGINESAMSEDGVNTNESANLDNIDQQTTGLDASASESLTGEADASVGAPDVEIMRGADEATSQQGSQETNPSNIRNNETLDPEVQAEIDAALSGGQAPASTNTQPESQNTTGSGNGNGSGDASYDAFLEASEKPILIDRSPAK